MKNKRKKPKALLAAADPFHFNDLNFIKTLYEFLLKLGKKQKR